MKCTGKLIEISKNWESNKFRLTFEVNEDITNEVNSIKDCEKLSMSVKAFKEKRSLDANAYCWVLCRKIAEKVGSTDVEVYEQCILDYGVTTIRPEQKDLVDDLVRMWDGMGIGNSHVILGDSKLDGYVNVKYYYGSSQYNTQQMARLIDGLVSDCKDLGIQTMTPAEIERMKATW